LQNAKRDPPTRSALPKPDTDVRVRKEQVKKPLLNEAVLSARASQTRSRKKTAIRKKDPSLAAAEDGSSTTPKEEESKNVI
jgi:hypothetical protein